MKLAIICPLAAQVQSPAFQALVDIIVECEKFVMEETAEPRRVSRFMYHRGQTAPARTGLGLMAAQSGAEWFLWFDDDMIPPEGVLKRLLSHGKNIVSAAYFSRSHSLATGEGQYPMCAFEMVDDKGKPFKCPPLEPRGLKEVQIVGFGCLLMHRKVWDDVWKLSGGQPFQTGVHFTEDVYFLNYARKAGHSVWLDTSLVAGHLKLVMVTDKNRERLGGEPQE